MTHVGIGAGEVRPGLFRRPQAGEAKPGAKEGQTLVRPLSGPRSFAPMVELARVHAASLDRIKCASIAACARRLAAVTVNSQPDAIRSPFQTTDQDTVRSPASSSIS